MEDIRFLDIPAGDSREVSKHPSAFFMDRCGYSTFRVLQVKLDGCWCDVPIIEFNSEVD